jgi:hypothetical protein
MTMTAQKKDSVCSTPEDISPRSIQPSSTETNLRVVAVTETSPKLHDDDDEQTDDDASSTVSSTSTVEYNQESFSSFQAKVTTLILHLFPSHTERAITLERTKAGAHTRIIGIALSEPQSRLPWYSVENMRAQLSACVRGRTQRPSKPKTYILRIPRSTAHNLHHQVATLTYLKHNFAFPVPSIVRFDSSADNALGRPYMLQRRLAGHPLAQLWRTLNQAQRKCAARYIAEVVRDMAKLTSRCGGIISARNTTHDLTTGFLRVEPVPVGPDSDVTEIYAARLAAPQTRREFLLELIERQRCYARDRGNPTFEHVWDGFVDMTNKLADAGLIPDTDAFHLVHGDLQSRNLLFAVTSPVTVRLTGILDWDSVLFAPRFVGMCAPSFLWSGDDADELGEDDARVEPTGAEKAELKRVFDDVVGEAFYRESYRREYVLARRMFYFLVKGIRSGGDVFSCEEVLEKWARLESGSNQVGG